MLGRAVPGAALGVASANRFPSLNILGQLLRGPQSSGSGLTLPGAELFTQSSVPVGLSPGEASGTAGQEFIDIGGQNDSIGTEGVTGSNTANTGAEERISRINYKPSSGVIIEATPGKTTTIIGSYDKDMKYIIDELGNVKTTNIGPNNGGFNVLNIPEEIYRSLTPEQFWEQYNKRWLDEAIRRGDDIVLATRPEGRVMLSFNKVTGEWGPSGLAREYQYLYDKGYHYDPVTNMMVK